MPCLGSGLALGTLRSLLGVAAPPPETPTPMRTWHLTKFFVGSNAHDRCSRCARPAFHARPCVVSPQLTHRLVRPALQFPLHIGPGEAGEEGPGGEKGSIGVIPGEVPRRSPRTRNSASRLGVQMPASARPVPKIAKTGRFVIWG